MAKATYMITSDFRTPYVTSSKDPRSPTQTNWKAFKKGDIIAGELIKDGKGKPNFVLYNGVCVVPLSVVRAVVTKEILSSNASGPANTTPLGQETTKKITVIENPKIKYGDAALVGIIIGLAGVFIANKKGWIKAPDNMNFLYGAGAGIALSAYFVYRQNNKPKPKTV